MASKYQYAADFKGKFGRKKEEAIVALLSQRTIEDAARLLQHSCPDALQLAEGA
jgi:hypothetical protein